MSLPEPVLPQEKRHSADTDSHDVEPRLQTRRDPHAARSAASHHPAAVAEALAGIPPAPHSARSSVPARLLRLLFIAVPLVLLLAVASFFVAEHWLRSSARAALPQLDGWLALPGLSAPATVQRDAHGVPHIQAATVDDLVLAQGFITAQDRLFQMDALRRHATGELAEILGPSMLPHDRLQRVLQIRAAADRAVAHLPADQLHLLEQYAKGVNAEIAAARNNLPIEFRVLHYTPLPWTPRDSVLVSLAMYEDLSNSFSTKLAREALTARLPADLVADLYPVGSWRDHPPATPEPDLTIPGPPIEEVPLDESQAALSIPASPGVRELRTRVPSESQAIAQIRTEVQSLTQTCASCTPGSNNWAVSGSHTASGKPLLSNDMHLNLTIPDIWYESDLSTQNPVQTGSEPLHVAGVTIPGLPLIVVGHTQHTAWGFTNLGADVQDVYIETTRGEGAHQEFQATDGTWQPLTHLPELIRVRGGRNETLDVTATRHGDTLTPILTPILANEGRSLSLRWTLYDPAAVSIPTLDFALAHDWPSFLLALAKFGGPTQNVVYADDQGHIGYHAIGRIPLRGPARNPAIAEPLPSDIASPLPAPSSTETPIIRKTPDPLNTLPIATATPAASPLASGRLSPVPLVPTQASEWSGYIPFDKLPQVFDPQGGVIATANARITPDDYPYPITLNWAAPYRNERIWRLLAHRSNLKPSDMLAIQSDIYSDFDHVLAQRIAYAVDHSQLIRNSKPSDRARVLQAADLLRAFSGQMTADSAGAAIIASVHNILWRVLLEPRLAAGPRNPAAGTRQSTSLAPTERLNSKAFNQELNRLYVWGEQDYALEQIVMHTPPRWLPPHYANWDDCLAASLDLALHDAKAPADLTKWHYGAIHTVDFGHPIFGQSPLLGRMLGMTTGIGNKPQSGDATTVKQVGHTFGPSERFTAELANPDGDTLNLTTGESGDPASAWYLDQFPAWYHVTTFAFPFTAPAVAQATTHTLTLTPP
jgi:penicillin amidase